RIQRGDFDVAVVPAPTALVRMCPPAYIAAHTFFLRAGETLDLESLKSQLATAGYQHVTQVVAPGEVCVRGGIIDLFPMGSTLPYRLDLDDELVDSIKTFDVDTQRTLYSVADIRLLPAREFPLDEAGRTRFRSRWRELFEGDPSKKRLYRDVSNGVPAAGIEYYLPLFFESSATLFDYLPKGCTLALHRDVSSAINDFWRDIQSRHRMQGGDPDRPLLAPAQMFLPAEEFYLRAKEHPRIDVQEAEGLGGHNRGRALCRRRAPARARGREAQLRRRDAARPLGAEDRRPGRARRARYRSLPGSGGARSRGRQGGVPAPRVRRRRQALCSGLAARRHRPLQRRPARRGAAPQAGKRPVGQGQGARREAGARYRRRAPRPIRQRRRPPR